MFIENKTDGKPFDHEKVCDEFNSKKHNFTFLNQKLNCKTAFDDFYGTFLLDFTFQQSLMLNLTLTKNLLDFDLFIDRKLVQNAYV